MAGTVSSTALNNKQAADRFTALSKPADAARASYTGQLKNIKANEDLSGLRITAGQYADALTTFHKGLTASEWPTDVQSLVDELDGHVSQGIIVLQTIASASTWAAADSEAANVNDTSIATDCNKIRQALGIPTG